uniref:coniferyl alcohol acyltransferase-like n=1 Tax=Erigeron canadensis TaxID=72917 RepID=UPI001CB8F41F|nr:coniferyl alcohol acyltransferase-like [Erigeron canadensis]
MDSYGTNFSVSIKQKDVVVAALPVQNHWLPMSNLDLLLPELDVGVFFCYKKSDFYTENVNLLKKSLAQALSPFYPLAGEIVQNIHGEPELLCNSRGVDFIHAYADVMLKDIDLHHPDDSVKTKFVPVKKSGVFSVQVTELNCGGLVIGCKFDHRVADAYSMNMFLVAWAEISKSEAISTVPSFRRSMLNPRRPLLIDSLYDTLFVPLSSLPPPNPSVPTNPLISRIYYVKSEAINNLQSISSLNGNPKRSKLVSLTAYLWRLMSECEDGSKTCRMGVVVDGRKRLDKLSLPMENYFGNILSIPYGQVVSDQLRDMPLSQVTTLVDDFINVATTEDHFRGLIDWVELKRPKQAVAKIYTKIEENDGDAIVVSSGQRFPVESVDFGWGKPRFGSYMFPWGGQTGYVMPMPSAKSNGDWIVYMYLLEKHLEIVETKGSEVFHPLNSTYLDF